MTEWRKKEKDDPQMPKPMDDDHNEEQEGRWTTKIKLQSMDRVISVRRT